MGLLLISSQHDGSLLQSYRRDALQSHKAVFDYTFSGFRPRLCQCKRLNMCLIFPACDKWLLRSIYYVVHIHRPLQLFPPSLHTRRVDFCLKLWPGLRAAFASGCRVRLGKIVPTLFSLSGWRRYQSVASRVNNNKKKTLIITILLREMEKTASFSFVLHPKWSFLIELRDRIKNEQIIK